MHNPRDFIALVVIPQLELYGVAGPSRIAAAFEGLEAEAEERAQVTFDLLTSGFGEDDPAGLAEEARDDAIDYYANYRKLEQGVMNLLTVGMYHLFEQHFQQFKNLLGESGIPQPDFKSLAVWTAIDELRYAANCLKHAEGTSCDQLRQMRPDLFEMPMLRGSRTGNILSSAKRPVRGTLGDIDVWITRDDIAGFYRHVRQFWNEVYHLMPAGGTT